MDLPKLNGGNFSDVFGGIKSKLGFNDMPGERTGRDDYYADSYDDQEDFAEYADDYAYDEFAEYAPENNPEDFGDYAESYADPYTTDSYAPRSAGLSGSSRSRAASSDDGHDPSRKVRAPKLISLDDVRARTQVPDSLNRDPLPPRKVTKPSSVVTGLGSIANIGRRDSSEPRSAGLKSLFNSTTEASVNSGYEEDVASVEAGFGAGQATYAETPERVDADKAYDPYEAYEATGLPGQQDFVAKRQISIISPMSYGDVEGVARSLKAGDVVVLVLTRTPDSLSKRVLDFSFGAASALDASVDSVAPKVFAITSDHALTPAERTELRNQGVL